MSRPVRCPKCRALPARFHEMWKDHSIEFEAQADGTPEERGALIDGAPYKVIAVCGGCGHEWTLRGVMQITEVREGRRAVRKRRSKKNIEQSMTEIDRMLGRLKIISDANRAEP